MVAVAYLAERALQPAVNSAATPIANLATIHVGSRAAHLKRAGRQLADLVAATYLTGWTFGGAMAGPCWAPPNAWPKVC